MFGFGKKRKPEVETDVKVLLNNTRFMAFLDKFDAGAQAQLESALQAGDERTLRERHELFLLKERVSQSLVDFFKAEVGADVEMALTKSDFESIDIALEEKALAPDGLETLRGFEAEITDYQDTKQAAAELGLSFENELTKAGGRAGIEERLAYLERARRIPLLFWQRTGEQKEHLAELEERYGAKTALGAGWAARGEIKSLQRVLGGLKKLDEQHEFLRQSKLDILGWGEIFSRALTQVRQKLNGELSALVTSGDADNVIKAASKHGRLEERGGAGAFYTSDLKVSGQGEEIKQQYLKDIEARRAPKEAEWQRLGAEFSAAVNEREQAADQYEVLKEQVEDLDALLEAARVKESELSGGQTAGKKAKSAGGSAPVEVSLSKGGMLSLNDIDSLLAAVSDSQNNLHTVDDDVAVQIEELAEMEPEELKRKLKAAQEKLEQLIDGFARKLEPLGISPAELAEQEKAFQQFSDEDALFPGVPFGMAREGLLSDYRAMAAQRDEVVQMIRAQNLLSARGEISQIEEQIGHLEEQMADWEEKYNEATRRAELASDEMANRQTDWNQLTYLNEEQRRAGGQEAARFESTSDYLARLLFKSVGLKVKRIMEELNAQTGGPFSALEREIDGIVSKAGANSEPVKAVVVDALSEFLATRGQEDNAKASWASRMVYQLSR